METAKLGSVGQRVAKQIAELRGRIPVRHLSQRLKQLGRPILPSGITKIEQGQRRVDADDLVALAVALEVTPTRLLLGPPPSDGPTHDPRHEDLYEIEEVGDQKIKMPFLRLLPGLALDPWECWTWATGEMPLGAVWEGEVRWEKDESAKFRAENSLPPPWQELGQAHGVHQAITGVDDAIKNALNQGLTEDQVQQMTQAAIATWRRDTRVRDENQHRYDKATQDTHRTRDNPPQPQN